MVSPDTDKELTLEQPSAEYDANGDLVVENTPNPDDAIPVLGNAWNKHVERKEVTEEQLERIRKIREDQSISPDERLKRLMTFPPSGFLGDPSDGAESAASEAKTPTPTNEPEQAQTPPEMPPDPISGPSGQETIYDQLGISDTAPHERRAVADPSVPMDIPNKNSDIMRSVKMSSEEVGNRGQTQYEQKVTEKALQAEPLVKTDQETTDPLDKTALRLELTEEQVAIMRDWKENAIAASVQIDDYEIEQAEEPNASDVSRNEGLLIDLSPTAPDQTAEPAQTPPLVDLSPQEEDEHALPDETRNDPHIRTLADLDNDKSDPAPTQLNVVSFDPEGVRATTDIPEVIKVDTTPLEENIPTMTDPTPEPTPPTPEPEKDPDPEPEKPVEQETPIASEDALQAALGDLPESTIDVGETDIQVDPNQKTPTNETELGLDAEDNITVENKRAALASISAVHATAVYGADAQQLFTPDDLDIVIDNDIPPAHMVVPNMTPDELQQYSMQSDPNQLQRSARQLFGTGNAMYEITREGIQDLRINLTQETSYPSRVHVANQQFASKEAQYNQDRLEKAKAEFDEKFPGKDWTISRAIRVKDKDGNLKVVDDSMADSKVLFDKIGPNAVGKVQSVSSAKVAAMLIGGYRLVNLYHSGFTVQLCAPLMDKLAQYYNSCIDKMNEFGRIFGQFAFLPAGVEKRAALLDLAESCVANSNLVNWNEPGVLRQAISVLDIPTLAWAMASLMHPRGIDVEFLCHSTDETTGQQCRHVEKARIDINSMRYNNWTRMSTDMVQFVSSRDKKTLEDLAKYRADLYKAAGTDFVISKDGKWSATLRIPSAAEAENAQRAYVAKMEEVVQLDNLDKVEVYFRSKYLASFAPYIGKVTYTRTEEDGTTKSLEFVEADALERSLDNLQLTPSVSLPEILSKYISDKTLTQIAFTYHPCPVCGKMPPDAVDGLVACDPEYAFFVWTMEKLRL